MKMHCDIIQDLIPLYIDGIISDKSKELVEEHLLECEKCKAIVDSMKINLLPEITNIEAKNPWLKIKRRSLLKNIVIFVVAPLLCFSLFVGFCTYSQEGLTLEAIIYQSKVNSFLHNLTKGEYEEAAKKLSFYGNDNVENERNGWASRMRSLDLDFSSLSRSPLIADDGLVSSHVTVELDDKNVLEFKIGVQGNGLSLHSFYIQGDEELEEEIRASMLSHNPG